MIIHKILKVLSYGKKIEKYALSGQAIAKALVQVRDDLEQIWGTDATVEIVNDSKE